MKQLILIATVFISGLNLAWAKSVHFEYPDYETAEKAESFLKFEGVSTKAGFISSTFAGYVKNFDVESDVTEQSFEKVKAIFKTETLDTDNGARNDKMWGKCLDSKTYPTVAITLSNSVARASGQQTIPGTILIRGVERPIQVKLSVDEDESSYTLKGETFISVKETQIPDPSIFIAKLRDKIDIFFQLKIKK
jgi:polyisoprenoid-binding protein YceI